MRTVALEEPAATFTDETGTMDGFVLESAMFV
jgi:hypothetical protein